MDEFGVLTERFGLKPQGKLAPMASSKRDFQNPQIGTNLTQNPNTSQFESSSHQNPTFDYASGLDDDIFGGNNKLNVDNGGSFDYDSIFAGSVSASVDNGHVDDIFGGFVSPPKQGVGVDDLLDKIGEFGTGNGSDGVSDKAPEFDDLIPGFSDTSVTNNGRSSTEVNKPSTPTVTSKIPTVTSPDDPFLVFETASNSESFLDSLEQISHLNKSEGTRSGSNTSQSLRSPSPKPKPSNVSNSNKVNNSSVSSIDELEEFAMGRVLNSPSRRANIHNEEIKQNSEAKTNKSNGAPNARVNESNGMDDHLEAFFSMSSRSTSAPKSRPTAVDNGSSASIRKSPVMTSFDDLSLIFGGSPSSEFNEVEGETEERRQARLRYHQRTQERAARALADMNQRDLQTKMEQEERRRIADTVDVHIMRWAAGKEGNMRALLSTLQDVLWPECGWEPVSLTDMIISTSVKKVYRKATLCIHPDKVQQKGANLEQKYTAEKVFDILKAAWNKFKIEELS